MQICISSSSCCLSSFNITTIIFMKEKDVKKKNFLYAIMHAIFDLLYKLPSACHFRQLSVSSFDLLCTGQSTKAKFEPKIIAFHYFLFSSSQVFVKQTYNTINGHYKFIEKSCLFIHMWQSHTKHYFMVHAMFGNELFLYIKSIPINGLLVFPPTYWPRLDHAKW